MNIFLRVFLIIQILILKYFLSIGHKKMEVRSYTGKFLNNNTFAICNILYTSFIED